MAYIGQSIKNGTFTTLDTSGNTYNGSNTAFALGTQVGSPAQLLVSHDGVLQKPGTDYTLSSGGTAITFTTAPASGASIFIVEISGAVGGPLGSDLNGSELILDADGDTSIHASTDDQIDVKIAGADDFKFTANSMNVLSGSTLTVDSGATITNSGTANGFSGIQNLGTTTVSGTPSEIDIDFDTSTYNQFRIFYEGIQATSDFNMYARAKVGGSIITASNYNSSTLKKHSGGLDSGVYGGQNQAYWYLTHNIGGATNENWGADMLINIGSETGMPMITMTTVYQDNSGNYASVFGGLCYQSFSIINGLRIYPSTGTFDAGKYTVWGIK